MKVRSINPRTGQIIQEFEPSSSAEVQSAFSRARKGQKEWFKGTSKEDRIALMMELKRVLEIDTDRIVDTIHEECGFPRGAASGECKSAIAGIGHYSSEYEKLADENFPLDQTSWPETKASIKYYPHGVVAHIGIWNYPLWQTMITAIPALLVGNSIVFKPSELSTKSGLLIAELIHRAGFPEDVYIPLIGGADVGKQMVRGDCDALVFTGGVGTGKDIAQNAGIKPLIMELPGNDAGIVCADADVEQAARGVATGTFERAGQICIRIKRVYVHQAVAQPFLSRLKEIASLLDVEKDIGPLIREEARERVDRVVQDAIISRGAERVIGGHKLDRPGFFYAPTILLINDDGLEVIRKETFGPVCSVRVVESEEEAIALANDSPYGLGATIWTSDFEKGERLSMNLEAGNIWINECGRALVCGELFQGWKQSGIPSTQRRLQMFLKKKTVIDHHSCEPRARWFK